MALTAKLIKFPIFNVSKRLIMSSQWNLAKAQEQLASNPYFDKYADKIKQLQSKNPVEFEDKLKQVAEKKVNKEKPGVILPNLQNDTEVKVKEQRVYKQMKLDDIMNISLLTDKSEKEIEEIWKEYYKTKENVIYATMDKQTYSNFISKCSKFPTFIIPLPKGEGFQFFLSQYFDNNIHFASLAQYQLHKDNCPELLCLTYFTELKQNIVLMLGEYDNKSLNGIESSCLVNTIQFFYNSKDKFELVKHFNENPQTFDHNELIKAINNLSIK